MVNFTRRALIRMAALATGAIGLTAETLSGQVNTAPEAESVFHVFAFQWKPGTTDAQIERARTQIRAFQGAIPGLLQTHVGPNLSPRGKGYTFGGIMQFKDQASLEAYVKNPAHKALLVWLVPLIDAIELDVHA